MDKQLIVYENRWVIDLIHTMIGQVANEITRTDKLEYQAVKRVGNYLAARAENIRHKQYIKRLIAREIKIARERYRIQETIVLSGISKKDENGQAVEFEPKDDLAIVEGRIELKETINLLAKDDRRRKLILTEWMQGNTNDSDISDTLARVFGGHARSHRIFVQRFRIECRAELTAQAI